MATQPELLRNIYQERGKIFDELNEVSPWHAAHRSATRATISKLGRIRQFRRTLDAAGGTAITSRMLKPASDEVVVLDLLTEMLALGRAASKSETTHYVCGNLQHLPFEDEGFDFISCTQALNFVEHIERALNELTRVCDQSGVILLDIENLYRWVAVKALAGQIDVAETLLQKEQDVDLSIIGANYYFHDIATIIGCLERAGFFIISQRGIGFVAPLFNSLARSADFLLESRVPERLSFLRNKQGLRKLLRIEERLAKRYPSSVAGWTQILATRDISLLEMWRRA